MLPLDGFPDALWWRILGRISANLQERDRARRRYTYLLSVWQKYARDPTWFETLEGTSAGQNPARLRCEGFIQKLELLKRQGYGRAGIELLRARMLAA